MSTPPDDPFEGEFPNGFESFSEDLQEFTRNLDRARPIVSALFESGSFQELVRAVGALDDDERDAALIMTFIDLRRQTDPTLGRLDAALIRSDGAHPVPPQEAETRD